MNAEKKPRRGRPPNSDSKIAATIFLCSEITARSGLTPAKIEEEFKIESTPPGNYWRRYLRGERAMSLEIRDRIARKAIKKGWLQTRLIVDDMNTAYGWILESSSLENAKKKAKELLKKQKELEKIRDNCINSLNILSDTLNKLSEDYWCVYHQDYANKYGEHPNDIDRYLVSLFPDELLTFAKKISYLDFDMRFRKDLAEREKK